MSRSWLLGITLFLVACIASSSKAQSCTGSENHPINSNSNAPAYTYWDLTLTVSPVGPNGQPAPVTGTGYGITGQQTGYYDCSAYPLTIGGKPPGVVYNGLITNQDGSITGSWTAINISYKPGAACTQGYCNGFQSLAAQSSMGGTYSLRAYCY